MKKLSRMIAVLLTLALAIGLCACGSQGGGSEKYLFYALDFDGVYVYTDAMEGRSLTLNNDGTGYLDWGDDNQGEISEWTADGDNLVIKAGISEMNATLKDGILTVDLDDGDNNWKVVFFGSTADTSGLIRISAVEYQDMISAGEDEHEGVYDCFGAENSAYPGYIIDMGEGYSYLQLSGDGKGYYSTAGAEKEIDSWSVDGGTFAMTVAGETITGVYDDGVIGLLLEDSGRTVYYAKAETDLSDYFILSQEEMDAIIEEYY